jgi:hypothetical protein
MTDKIQTPFIFYVVEDITPGFANGFRAVSIEAVAHREPRGVPEYLRYRYLNQKNADSQTLRS